jgi:hypothetical protein
MSNQSPNFWLFLIPGAVLAVMVGYLLWWPSHTLSILQRWASSKRFEILQCERCFLHGGFRWWTTSHKQTVFFVKIRDDSGHERSGWVRFGRFLGGGYKDEPDVIWSDHETNAA